MRILIINGSHRAGNTDIIVNKLTEEIVKTGNTADLLILKNIEMKLPDGCEVCAESEICPNINDEFSQKVEPSIRNYDAYIIATPIWSDSITPLTKIFWDRIVTWCNKDRMYLKNKKLAVVVHGMADENSWDLVINWVKGICTWEESLFAGSIRLKSGSKVGDIQIDIDKIKVFIQKIVEPTQKL